MRDYWDYVAEVGGHTGTLSSIIPCENLRFQVRETGKAGRTKLHHSLPFECGQGMTGYFKLLQSWYHEGGKPQTVRQNSIFFNWKRNIKCIQVFCDPKIGADFFGVHKQVLLNSSFSVSLQDLCTSCQHFFLPLKRASFFSLLSPSEITLMDWAWFDLWPLCHSCQCIAHTGAMNQQVRGQQLTMFQLWGKGAAWGGCLLGLG